MLHHRLIYSLHLFVKENPYPSFALITINFWIEHGSRTISLENLMRIADALAVPLSYLMYEIPITERILNILNDKSRRQQEYLIHMLEEMSFGLDKL